MPASTLPLSDEGRASLECMESYVQSHRERVRVQSYQELLTAYRGVVKPAMDFVRSEGVTSTDYDGSEISHFAGELGKRLISATWKSPNTLGERLTIVSYVSRKLSFGRKAQSTLNFTSASPRSDVAATSRPNIGQFYPSGYSPQDISWWTDRGKKAVDWSADKPDIVRATEAFAVAHEASTCFNRFLGVTVELIDDLVQAGNNRLK